MPTGTLTVPQILVQLDAASKRLDAAYKTGNPLKIAQAQADLKKYADLYLKARGGTTPTPDEDALTDGRGRRRVRRRVRRACVNGAPRRVVQRGLWFEELEVGTVYEHRPGRTVSESDNILFSTLTMNHQALHLDAAFAAEQPFGQRLMNSMFTLVRARRVCPPTS